MKMDCRDSEHRVVGAEIVNVLELMHKGANQFESKDDIAPSSQKSCDAFSVIREDKGVKL